MHPCHSLLAVLVHLAGVFSNLMTNGIETHLFILVARLVSAFPVILLLQ